MTLTFTMFLFFLFLVGAAIGIYGYGIPLFQSHALLSALKRLDEANRTIASLRETNLDLDAQIRDSLLTTAITPAELSEIARIRAEHLSLTSTQNVIALYLRNSFGEEIARGDHAGMELEKVVCMYLGRYKMLMAEREEKAKGH